ncbi:MAG: 50S ribosomal protein L13 [Myxococcales bacterium]|nr:50S ribosomal protein L13 [Myxococcales bacterium]
MQKTYQAKVDELPRQWHLIDASDQTLGRIATQIATLLRGKHKPQYTPHVDTGDFVIVINAEKVRLTGNKLDSKHFHHHSGYPGGLHSESYRHLIDRKPEFIIEKAVRGMLPYSPLGRAMRTKLKVYKGAVHPHAAQQPKLWKGHAA